MSKVLFAVLLMASTGVSAGRAGAESFDHTYDITFAGLRVASAIVRGDVTETGYNAVGQMQARGLVGAFTSGGFNSSVRGTRTGPAGFAPQVFVQESSGREASRLDITYRAGVPVTHISTPARDPGERPVPTLSKQADTVDFLTAIVALTYPGTAQEICARTFDTFTLTRRTRMEGQGVGPDGTSCTVMNSKVDPETLEVRDPEPYTLELRPLAAGQFEVARILGPSEFGQAIIARTN